MKKWLTVLLLLAVMLCAGGACADGLLHDFDWGADADTVKRRTPGDVLQESLQDGWGTLVIRTEQPFREPVEATFCFAGQGLAAVSYEMPDLADQSAAYNMMGERQIRTEIFSLPLTEALLNDSLTQALGTPCAFTMAQGQWWQLSPEVRMMLFLREDGRAQMIYARVKGEETWRGVDLLPDDLYWGAEEQQILAAAGLEPDADQTGRRTRERVLTYENAELFGEPARVEYVLYGQKLDAICYHLAGDGQSLRSRLAEAYGEPTLLPDDAGESWQIAPETQLQLSVDDAGVHLTYACLTPAGERGQRRFTFDEDPLSLENGLPWGLTWGTTRRAALKTINYSYQGASEWDGVDVRTFHVGWQDNGYAYARLGFVRDGLSGLMVFWKDPEDDEALYDRLEKKFTAAWGFPQPLEEARPGGIVHENLGWSTETKHGQSWATDAGDRVWLFRRSGDVYVLYGQDRVVASVLGNDLVSLLLRDGITPDMTIDRVSSLAPGELMQASDDDYGTSLTYENVPVLGKTARGAFVFRQDELRLALFALFRDGEELVDRSELEAELTARYGQSRMLGDAQAKAIFLHALQQEEEDLGFYGGRVWQVSDSTQAWTIRGSGLDMLILIVVPPVPEAAAQGVGEWLLREGITPAMTVETLRAAERFDYEELAAGDELYIMCEGRLLAGVRTNVTYMFDQGMLSMVNYTVTRQAKDVPLMEAARTALTDRLGEGRKMPLAEVGRIMMGPDVDLSGMLEMEALGWQLPGESWLFLYEGEGIVKAMICREAQ